MKIQMIPVKACAVKENVGSIQCANGYARSRMIELLGRTRGVRDARRISWDIIYFETEEGIKASDVLEGVHISLPIIWAEMISRRPWLIRNFWLLWGATFGICHFTDMADAFISGDIWQIPRSWLAGLFIIAISFVNHSHFKWRRERIMDHVRRECVARIKEKLSAK